jgi:hypothetical protein
LKSDWFLFKSDYGEIEISPEDTLGCDDSFSKWVQLGLLGDLNMIYNKTLIYISLKGVNL